MTGRLEGKRVVVLLAEGFEDLEFHVPLMRLQEEGAEVTVAGPTTDEVAGKHPGEIITATDLNLRQSPSQDASVTAVMPRGEQVVPTGQHRDGFVEVRWQDATGWAFGKHLTVRRRARVKSDRDPTSWRRRELIAIIYEAADRYGQPREDMLRVARCESDLVPTAVFQFKPRTWLGTPFAEYDIFDPRASANAAAWMWSQGRRREWVCQ